MSWAIGDSRIEQNWCGPGTMNKITWIHLRISNIAFSFSKFHKKIHHILCYEIRETVKINELVNTWSPASLTLCSASFSCSSDKVIPVYLQPVCLTTSMAKLPHPHPISRISCVLSILALFDGKFLQDLLQDNS